MAIKLDIVKEALGHFTPAHHHNMYKWCWLLEFHENRLNIVFFGIEDSCDR